MPLVITTEEQWKTYVEEMTGNSKGGTCHRPDIKTGIGVCDTCEYVRYCLVETKIVLTQTKKSGKIKTNERTY